MRTSLAGLLLAILALSSGPAWAEETEHEPTAQQGQGEGQSEKSRKVEFKSLAQGELSGYRTEAHREALNQPARLSVPAQNHEFRVISDRAAWSELWHRHAGAKAKPPAIDFQRRMVIALFMGRRLTEGFHIKVEGISPGGGDELLVHYSETAPSKGKHRALITNPFHFVSLPRSTGLVSFTRGVAHHEAHIAPKVQMLFGALLVAMILTLAFEEKIHAKKSIITGTYALITLFLGMAFDIMPAASITNSFGESLHIPLYISAIDWEVISIILASSIFVDVTSKSGIFTWIAIKLTKTSGGDPLKLLWYYGAMTVVFSAVLNNVTAMIIVGSLTAVSLDKLKKTELMLGFLLIEGLLTNIGGLLTLISSVPNIIVGSTAGISFMKFFMVAVWYVLVATAVTIWLGARRYQIVSLKGEEAKTEAASLVAGFDENDGIESEGFFKFSAVVFLLFIGVLATTSNIPVLKDLQMGYVAGIFAVIMLLRYRSEVDKFYAQVDWDLIGFFAFLFVVINVMEHAQVLGAIGGVIGAMTELGDYSGGSLLLWSSAAASSVTDNIPLAAMLSKILASAGTPSSSPFWWCVIFGANLGGNLTPIGSASTVVAVTVMHKYKIKLSFVGFVLAALPFAIIQLVLATIYVMVFLV